MRIRIKDKKVFAEFVAAAAIVVGALSFFAYKIVQPEKGGDVAVTQEQKENSKGSFSVGKSPARTDSGSKTGSAASAAVVQAEYSNKTYRYGIAYPDNWHINTEFSDSKQEAARLSNPQVTSGGQTFWSNYKNIDDFSPDSKPADFHLLGLTVYEASGLDEGALAALVGFDAASTLKTQAFAAKGISGKQYIAAGADEKNPSVAVIFRKGARFFVFNLGFINGDADAAAAMENIVKTFSLS